MKAVTLLCCLIGSQSVVSWLSLFRTGLLLFLLHGIHSIDRSIHVFPFIITKLNGDTGVVCFVSGLTCSAFYLNEPRRFRHNCIFGPFFFSGTAPGKRQKAQGREMVVLSSCSNKHLMNFFFCLPLFCTPDSHWI